MWHHPCPYREAETPKQINWPTLMESVDPGVGPHQAQLEHQGGSVPHPPPRPAERRERRNGGRWRRLQDHQLACTGDRLRQRAMMRKGLRMGEGVDNGWRKATDEQRGDLAHRDGRQGATG